MSQRRVKLILVLCMVAIGVPFGAWASDSWLGALFSVEFAAVGLMIGLLVVHRIVPPTTRRALAERGQEFDLPLTLRLTPDGLVYDLGDVTLTARWPCVTDLYATRRYWVFLVQSSAMVLPRRFFATPHDEREFISEAMARMPAAAQARSPDAAKLVGR